MTATSKPKPKAPSRSRVSKAVRDAILGHKESGLPVSETVVEVEGERIRIRIRTETRELTTGTEAALLSDLMAAQMGADGPGAGRGKRAS